MLQRALRCLWYNSQDPASHRLRCTPSTALAVLEKALWCVSGFWRVALILIDPHGWHRRSLPTNQNKQTGKSIANVRCDIMRTMRVLLLQQNYWMLSVAMRHGWSVKILSPDLRKQNKLSIDRILAQIFICYYIKSSTPWAITVVQLFEV